MSLKYNIIEIFTSEETRWNNKPVWDSVVEYVNKSSIAARCLVYKAFSGSYENAEIASSRIETLSYNMPIKIEIVLPAAELETILHQIEEMVSDGIVAVRDVMVGLHRTNKRLIPRQLKIKDVMTPSPRTVTENTNVGEVIQLLLANDFNAVPVIDDYGQPAGIITQGDLISRAAMPVRLGLLGQFEQGDIEGYINSLSNKTASEVMTKPVITIKEDKSITEAVELMLERQLKRLVIVNSGDKITGVLARADIFKIITKLSPNWKAIEAQKVRLSNAKTIKDITRRDTHKVNADTFIDEVIRIIDENDIQRVVVVDEEDHFLGMIFDSDLFDLFSENKKGFWKHLLRKISFTEIAKKQKELISADKKIAADVMRADIITVLEDMSIEEAIKIMAEKGIKRLPVIDNCGVFKGMISRDSILRIT